MQPGARPLEEARVFGDVHKVFVGRTFDDRLAVLYQLGCLRQLKSKHCAYVYLGLRATYVVPMVFSKAGFMAQEQGAHTQLFYLGVMMT